MRVRGLEGERRDCKDGGWVWWERGTIEEWKKGEQEVESVSERSSREGYNKRYRIMTIVDHKRKRLTSTAISGSR